MQDFKIELRGSAPLLMHSSRLSNPLDPAAKALKSATSKRSKTDEDHELVSIVKNAGAMCGLGDWRPRFGRFTGTVEPL